MPQEMTSIEKIIVLDFGNPYNQEITRGIRELNVFSELHPHTMTAEEIQAEGNVIGIIMSGGPFTVYEDIQEYDPQILELGIPVLGIGRGMQVMINELGATVTPAGYQYEPTDSQLTFHNVSEGIFKGAPASRTVPLGFDAKVSKLPDGFSVLASGEEVSSGDDRPFGATENPERSLYGVQFVMEIEKNDADRQILENFVLGVCDASQNWTMKNYLSIAVHQLKAQIGDQKVLLGLSGGVDSSVVGVLLQRTLGDQLTCIFVDNGLLRKGEGEDVMNILGEEFGLNIVYADAADRFLDKLAGIDDPEEKRKIIGNEFIYVFDDEAAKLEHVKFLAQGTLYSDVMESGTSTSEVVKSHHNVGGLPEDLDFELVEPLRLLFKDEVRQLGLEMGLPDEIVWRQPFPGPGLGIRVLGEVTREKLHILREADAVLRRVVAENGLQREIWQYFAVLPGIRSVGTTDGRTYDYTIGIRAVNSVDGMTSEFARIPYEVLNEISQAITEEVAHVNRVVYDITAKPPSTIEWE